MQFLTSEQAMADYAELLTELKHDLGAESSAVIGFGGSYGALPPQTQSLPARCLSNDIKNQCQWTACCQPGCIGNCEGTSGV